MLSSVANALRVLEFLARRGEAGVSEIASGLGLTVGTSYRLVSTLHGAGFAEQNPANRKYRPGPKVLELATMLRSRADFIELAHPVLRTLMEQTNHTANLGVLREDRVVYVDRVVAKLPFTVEVQIGSSVPAYCTGLGKAILALSPAPVRESFLRRLPGLAQGGIVPAPDVLRKQLDQIADVGFAEDRGDFSPDISCVAAPVVAPGGEAIAAVSVSGLRSMFEPVRGENTRRVVEAGEELSRLLAVLGRANVNL